MPIEGIGQSVVAQIISEAVRLDTVSVAQPDLQSPEIVIEPPRVDLPLGRPVVSQPMVVVEARFATGVPTVVAAAEYPPGLRFSEGLYRADVAVQIFEDGAVGEVRVERSGGVRAIDDFIVSFAKSRWRFAPALSDGIPVPSWKNIALEVTAEQMLVR